MIFRIIYSALFINGYFQVFKSTLHFLYISIAIYSFFFFSSIRNLLLVTWGQMLAFSSNFIMENLQIWLYTWAHIDMFASQGSSSFSFKSCLPSGWKLLLVSGTVTLISERIFLDKEEFWQTFPIHVCVGLLFFILSCIVMYVLLIPFSLLCILLNPLMILTCF